MGILGVDYGLKRIGIAVSDWGEKTRPLGTFSHSEVLENLNKWLKEYSLTKIVIGLSGGKLEKKILSWGEKIHYTYNIKVDYQDETLTSYEAKKLMIESNVPMKKRKELVDAYSACLILEEYLEKSL
ncbi:MAG: Holliday junction resolvase RuvX [Patescibacteria group bacterium]|nr:Holliday junction resolvase RuvX [Patescibacteria group bacterium]